jgi:uncharacterized protein (TIGR04551 family)
MRKASFAVTALAGLVSWSALASAEQAAPAEQPSPREPAAPGAKNADAKKSTDAAAAPKGAAPQQPAPEDAAPAPGPAGTSGQAPGGEPTAEPTPGSAVAPAPAPAAPETRPASTGAGAIGLWPQQAPATGSAQGAATPAAPAERKPDESVLAEDWWSHARPVFEIHGFFRTRGELFHNFSLGRTDSLGSATWQQPIDNAYQTPNNGAVGPFICTVTEAGGPSGIDNPADATHPLTGCTNKTQAGANLRFRLDPELDVSDNLRVISQIDLLDNVVMGSTPSGYAFLPAASGGGYQVAPRSGAAATGVADATTTPPTSGVNSLSNSIAVKRVWAEYATPVGELRFGRMPDHFGLGMVHHSGDGYDDDYQTTIDRLQFITAIKPLDLYFGGSWDFPNEGPISKAVYPGGQPYDLGQLDDVNQWSLVVMRKQSPELVKTALAHEQIVVNGGAYVTLRKQLLANDQNGSTATAISGANVPNATGADLTKGFSRRDAIIWTPDLWLQLRYKKFRFEGEAAAVIGSVESDSTAPNTTAKNQDFVNSGRKIREYGFAGELEQRLVEDKLRLGFNFGWASGDAAAFNPETTNNLIAGPNQQPVNSDTISTFRFNPAYRVDLILNRNLLQRIQGVYYVKPSAEYDFMRKPSGQRLGGGAGIIWTRAGEFVQTPGHARDLGIELDGKLYFQSKDGGLNDKPGKMGGFYAMLEYGVLFPLAGLGYMSNDKNRIAGTDTSAAQILRLYLGVLF